MRSLDSGCCFFDSIDIGSTPTMGLSFFFFEGKVTSHPQCGGKKRQRLKKIPQPVWFKNTTQASEQPITHKRQQKIQQVERTVFFRFAHEGEKFFFFWCERKHTPKKVCSPPPPGGGEPNFFWVYFLSRPWCLCCFFPCCEKHCYMIWYAVRRLRERLGAQ